MSLVPPSPLDTYVCDSCGHVQHLHVFHSAIRGCLVPKCPCKALGAFLPPVPPQIEEYNTHMNTRVRVPQPAPPNPAYRIDPRPAPYTGPPYPWGRFLR